MKSSIFTRCCFNTRSAVASIERISKALERKDHASAEFLRHLDRSSFLNELQNMILHAAALSRYFWPVRKGHEVRAKQLREVFGVTETNPLKNRDLRNEIEHFDEELEAYLSEGIAGSIFPEFVRTSSGERCRACPHLQGVLPRRRAFRDAREALRNTAALPTKYRASMTAFCSATVKAASLQNQTSNTVLRKR